MTTERIPGKGDTMHGFRKTRALLAAAAVGTVVAMAGPVPAMAAGTQSMWRLYNPNSGEHFYTASAQERDYLASLGWHREGLGWTAPSSSSTPVYRLYNRYAGDHHYTSSASERDYLVSVGWNYEGVGWYSDDAHGTPLYRQYNPYARSGAHNYTTSKAENDHLASIGWHAEGIGWYGVSAASGGASQPAGGSQAPSGPAGSGSGTAGQPTVPSGYRPVFNDLVTYDGNGATSGTTEATGTARAAACGFTRSTAHGKAPFLGWNTKPDGSGRWVSPGESAPQGTLYAQWDTWVDTSAAAWDETVTDKPAWDEQVADGPEVREPLVDYGYYQEGDNIGLRDGSRGKVILGGSVEATMDGYVIVQADSKADAQVAAEAFRQQGWLPWYGGSWDGGRDLPIKQVVPYSYGELYDIGICDIKDNMQRGYPVYNDNVGYTDYDSWAASIRAKNGEDGLRKGLINRGLSDVMCSMSMDRYQDTHWYWRVTQPTKTVHHDAETHVVHHPAQSSGHWAHNG